MYFSQPVLFKLPVLPRVAKFVRVKLTDARGHVLPMLVSPDATGAGLMLWALAQSEKVQLFSGYEKRAGSRNRSPASRLMHADAMTQTLEIAIHEYHYTRERYLLNIPELWVFSNMVDHMIRNEAVQFCKQQTATAPLTRIKLFCDTYDFSDDDFSELSLKQLYLRYRNGKSASGFASQLTTHLPFIPVAA